MILYIIYCVAAASVFCHILDLPPTVYHNLLLPKKRLKPYRLKAVDLEISSNKSNNKAP